MKLDDLQEYIKDQREKNDRHRDLADAAVKEATVLERERDRNYLLAALKVQHTSEVGMNKFLDITKYLEEVYGASRLEKNRSAVAHRQVEDLPVNQRWTRDERFTTGFCGLKDVKMGFRRSGAEKRTLQMRNVVFSPFFSGRRVHLIFLSERLPNHVRTTLATSWSNF